MNKTIKKVIESLLFVAIIVAFIIIGKTDFSPKKPIDNEKFDHDYTNVSADNVYKYVNSNEVYSFLRSGTGVLFLGYPTNKWKKNILNDAAKELGLKEILYYDFYEDKAVKNATYQSLVLKLNNFLPTLDDGTQNLQAPSVIIVKEGTIIYYDDETSINRGTITPDEYWNEFKIKSKQESLKEILANNLNTLTN